MSNSKLENPSVLGLHLTAGAADGFLTSASEVKNEKKNQSVQVSLDALFAAVGSTENGAVTDIAKSEAANNITVTYANGKTKDILVTEVVDILTSTSTTSPLSAAQGKALKDALDKEINDRGTAITEAVNALDVEDAEIEGQFIYIVSEVDGKIKVSRKAVDASVVTFTSAKGITATKVSGALDELKTTVDDNKTAGVVKVTEAAGSGDIAKVYTITQGESVIGTINIAKDLVVSSGTVVKGNWVEGAFTEDAEAGTGTALKLIIANQATPVYINTKDLVKDSAAGDGITITGDDASNTIAIKLATSSEAFLTVGPDGLKLAGVQKAIDTAVKTAKDAIDAYTVNGKKISTSPVLAAEDIEKADGTTVEADLNKLAAADTQIRKDFAAADETTLKSAKSYTDEQVRDLKDNGSLHQYVETATAGTSKSILGTAHNCGKHPIVKTYLGGAEVDCNVVVDFETGNVTVSWNGSIVSESNVLTIVVIGNPKK